MTGNKRPSGTHATKPPAVAQGRQLASRSKSELVIHYAGRKDRRAPHIRQGSLPATRVPLRTAGNGVRQAKILEETRNRGGDHQKGAEELPDKVDHEQHADVLKRFGVDPDDVAEDPRRCLGF